MEGTKEGKPDRNVSFNNRVTVVLIPQRKEIKAAGCDLWWSRGDYSAFQQSAHSEIRLYAMYENINCKEAKNMLYQPSENDLTKLDEDPDPADSGWELTPAATSEDAEDAQEEEEGSFSPILLRHVDSVSLLTDYDASPDPSQVVQRSKSTATISSSPEKRPKESASEDDLHSYVSFCVPSPECVPLMEVTPSSDSRKGRISQRLDQSSGFAVVCGIFSFTLPIIGYYLMHYSN